MQPAKSSYAEFIPQVPLDPAHFGLFGQLLRYRIGRILKEFDAHNWDAHANPSEAHASIVETERKLELFLEEITKKKRGWDWDNLSSAMALLPLPMSEADEHNIIKREEAYGDSLVNTHNAENAEAAFLRWWEMKIAVAVKDTFSLCLGFQQHQKQASGDRYVDHIYAKNQAYVMCYRDRLNTMIGDVPDDPQAIRENRAMMRSVETLKLAMNYLDMTLESYEAFKLDEEPGLPPPFKRFLAQVDGNIDRAGACNWRFRECVKIVYDITRLPNEPPAASAPGLLKVQHLMGQAIQRVADLYNAEIRERAQG